MSEALTFSAWNAEEEEALQGLPWGCRLLYLQGLRQYMDWDTRLVGSRRRVSWNGLRDVLYVEPHQGETQSGKPSKEAVRRMGKRLERAGLVTICSEKDEKRLVFFLPLASHRPYSAQKKPDTNPTYPEGGKAARHAATFGTHAEPLCDAGLTGVAEAKADTEADTNPTQAKIEKPTHIQIPDVLSIPPPIVPPHTVSRSRSDAGTRLSPDWVLPVAWEEWAMTERRWSADQVRSMAEGFRDYWVAVPGQKGVKLDWLATWRNWVRKQREDRHAAHQRQDNSARGRVERAIAARQASEPATRPAGSSEGEVIELGPGDYHAVAH